MKRAVLTAVALLWVSAVWAQTTQSYKGIEITILAVEKEKRGRSCNHASRLHNLSSASCRYDKMPEWKSRPDLFSCMSLTDTLWGGDV